MSEPADPLRDSLVLSLYRAALSPDEFEAFAGVWLETLSEAETAAPRGEAADGLNAHFDLALDMISKAQFDRAEPQDEDALLDGIAESAAIIDPAGSVISANARFAERFGPVRSIFALAVSAAEQQKIRTGIMSLHRLAERTVTLVAFTDRNEDLQCLSVRRLMEVDADTEARYLIQFVQQSWNEALEPFLMREFGITLAEMAFLRAVIHGAPIRKIAAMLGKSDETVRSQAKSVYRKLGVAGREDSLRLLSQMDRLVSGARLLTDGAGPSDRSGFVILGDGRRVHWTARGADSGRRVLFLHGISLGHAMSRSFEQALAGMGLTAICIDRPGYGDSDPPPSWKRPVDSFLDMFPELVSLLDIGPAPILTTTGGVVYGVAAAARYPELVTGVCAISAGVPITDARMLSSYPFQIQVAARTSRVSASALRFLIMSAASDYKRPERRDRLIRQAYGSVEPDARGLEDPEIWSCVHEGFELISKGGFDGYVGDCLLMFQDWSDRFERNDRPVFYINGDQDQVCPVEWAEAFSQRYPNVFVRQIEGGGQLICHTHTAATVGHLQLAFDHIEQEARRAP